MPPACELATLWSGAEAQGKVGEQLQAQAIPGKGWAWTGYDFASSTLLVTRHITHVHVLQALFPLCRVPSRSM